MAIVAEVTRILGAATGARAVHRWYTGRMLLSSSDTDDGFSLTLMDIGRVYGGLCYSLIACLDHPVSASGWTFSGLDGRLNLAQHPTLEYVRHHCHRPYDHDEDDDDDDVPPSTTVSEDQVPFVTDVLSILYHTIIL
ncbi:unnamed protein product [Macrosiphum euphorbiae]|uniref:Fungal-type protein kinase domain-containing protein n=1 Tax=Macrosiphum euphorbiae TaxID=13131 RepID=A0AAV0X4W9_9HEMI|nr:unnamed protein product [Macrosiphum euphorbiae]